MIWKLVLFCKNVKNEQNQYVAIKAEGRILDEYIEEKLSGTIKISNKMFSVVEEGGVLNQCRAYQILQLLE